MSRYDEVETLQRMQRMGLLSPQEVEMAENELKLQQESTAKERRRQQWLVLCEEFGQQPLELANQTA